MADESHGIQIHHPEMGWVPVTVVSGHEFAVSSAQHHVWFSMSDEVVATWPMRMAGAFIRWAERVAA